MAWNGMDSSNSVVQHTFRLDEIFFFFFLVYAMKKVKWTFMAQCYIKKGLPHKQPQVNFTMNNYIYKQISEESDTS